MKQFSKELGKVSVTPKGAWNINTTSERLDIVYDKRNNQAYIAKQNVPVGVDIDNREYWQPMNVTGYADNNFINLTTENENGTITAYESLEEAVATILPINRRVGATLSFYNLNTDRLDRQAEFELWQFNSTDLANWENKNYWNNIYYNWNVFAGWYVSVDSLENHVKIPNVGQYAYVGTNLNDALLYQCRTNGIWTNTGIKIRNYISVVVSGNITIGENGNWFSDGEDTGIPATPAVDEQLDNIIIQLQQHTTEISNLKKSDANLQDQITSNDSDITSLTAKHKSLSKTVQGIAATGGASTATNVTYNNDSSGLNAENAQDAIDELQGSKIDKTSIAQDFGNSENLVISQKTITNYTAVRKLKRNPILDPDICSKGSKYLTIEDLILDLEIISDSTRNFAPVVFIFSGNEDFRIDFYEVDEKGNYISPLKAFSINFKTTERKFLYILDKEVSVDSYNAKVSIAIDSSALASNFYVYSPSFVASNCKGEHWGLISILRAITTNTANITDIEDKINLLYTYGNSLFQNLTETDQFLHNGSLSSNNTYVGYMSGTIPVKKGDKYRCYGDFNFDNWDGNIYGYTDTSYDNPIPLGRSSKGKGCNIEIPDGVNYIRMCAAKTLGQVPYIVPLSSIESYFGESIENLNGSVEYFNNSIENLNGSILPVAKPIKVIDDNIIISSLVKNKKLNSFIFHNTTTSAKWIPIHVGTREEFETLDNYSKLSILITFDAEKLLEDSPNLGLFVANGTEYIQGENRVVKSINSSAFVSVDFVLSSVMYADGLYIWIQGNSGAKWKISNFKIVVVPTYYLVNKASVDNTLALVDDTLIQIINNKQSRISIYDMAKCVSNLYIKQIQDFLLDLEIIWDKEPKYTYALVTIHGSPSEDGRSVGFYAVDENGHYIKSFISFGVGFDNTKAGVQYALDKAFSTSVGDSGKISIVVDWDKWTENVNAMFPCYHSNSIYSEHVGPIMYLRQSNVLSNKFNVLSISNGDKNIYLTTKDNFNVSNKTENSFEITTKSKDSTWSYTKPPFIPSGKNYVHIKFKLECLTPDLLEQGATDYVSVWLSDGRTDYVKDKCVPLKSYKNGDEVHLSFDPAYYTVYKGWTEFGVWLSISAGTSGGTVKWRITDFEVYENLENVKGLNGNNAKELFEDAATKIAVLNETVSNLEGSDTELISPSGNKFELSVQDDGTLTALPIVPSKGVMYGNSLLMGSGYGMAASDSEHDYFHLITEFIKTLNPEYTAKKISAVNIENLTSEGEIDDAVKKTIDVLTGDETMISIQLGDNVNTDEKNAVFPKSSLALCKALRIKCPRARIVWMGMWFGTAAGYKAIQNACSQTGCKFISFVGLTGSDANSKIGNIQKKSSAQRTINNVTNVVENSSTDRIKNITITFTVGDASYNSTLDVTAYSLSGGTLTYTSEYEIIISGGVASHPGDEGFRRIANKFLYEMKLTDDSEYYKKNK